jgi:serine/threonine protein kinase
LLGYVNNSEGELDGSHWLVALGVEVHLSETTGLYTLRGYYKTFVERKAKIAIVKIAEGYWDQDGIAKLLHTLHSFLMRDPAEFRTPQHLSLHTRHCVDNGFVYKVYDSREHQTSREPEPNFLLLENCETVIAQSRLTIIRYPFIDGSHLPSNSSQIRTAIEALLVIHNLHHYLHGDLRASNIVFSDSGSKIIDFDLAKPLESNSRYPPHSMSRLKMVNVT